MPTRVLVDLNRVISKTTFLVAQSAIDQLFELLDTERFELKDLRTRDERAVYVKERVVSRRTDEAEISRFDVGQENVLLRFVEVMNLVDEQDRLLAGSAEAIGCGSDDAAHFGNVTLHATNSNKLCMGYFGNDPSQRRFSAAGRPEENHGGQTISFDCPAQKFSRPKNMFLADKFVERARAHARGERRSTACALQIDNFLFLEEIVHRGKYGAGARSASQFRLRHGGI